MIDDCEHLQQVKKRHAGVVPSGHGCKECLEAGSEWVHLRLCLTCGHVGCCDDSPNRHASKHGHHMKHPVIRSFEPGEDWGYCFVDDAIVEELKAYPGEAARSHYSAP
jgi:thioredoxin reductase (NADPH)